MDKIEGDNVGTSDTYTSDTYIVRRQEDPVQCTYSVPKDFGTPRADLGKLQAPRGSTDFGHLILVVPYFRFVFLYIYILFLVSVLARGAPGGPVVLLLGRWCS